MLRINNVGDDESRRQYEAFVKAQQDGQDVSLRFDAENPSGHIEWLDGTFDELPEPGPEVDDMGRFILKLCVGYVLIIGVVWYLGHRLFLSALSH